MGPLSERYCGGAFIASMTTTKYEVRSAFREKAQNSRRLMSFVWLQAATNTYIVHRTAYLRCIAVDGYVVPNPGVPPGGGGKEVIVSCWGKG